MLLSRRLSGGGLRSVQNRLQFSGIAKAHDSAKVLLRWQERPRPSGAAPVRRSSSLVQHSYPCRAD
jgi:hypothetical protein